MWTTMSPGMFKIKEKTNKQKQKQIWLFSFTVVVCELQVHLILWSRDSHNCGMGRGRSQTLNLGWARDVHFLICPHFSIIFSPFFLNLSSFSSSIWSSGWAAWPPGKALAMPLVGPHLASHYSLVLVQRNTLGYSIHLTLTHLSLKYFWPFLTCQIIENNCHKVCCAEVTLLESSDQY